jgi:hypothetical protein
MEMIHVYEKKQLGLTRKYRDRRTSLKGVFASGGGLATPTGLRFGPDGNLYVGNVGPDNVLRFDGKTGALWVSLLRTTNLNILVKWLSRKAIYL